MRLRVRSWGTGPRTVLLVHGYSDDSETWWRVGPALADEGCTVLAPDLRGHGLSPRSDGYDLGDLAQDLVESLPTGADLAVGHSLGALLLGIAVPALRPRRALYVDPAWHRRRGDLPLSASLPSSAAELGAAAERWSAEDVGVDLASNGRLDPRLAGSLFGAMGPDEVIAPPGSGSRGCVLVPAVDAVLPVSAHPLLQDQGYLLRTVGGVGHVIHRDDHEAFLAVLRDELAVEAVA